MATSVSFSSGASKLFGVLVAVVVLFVAIEASRLVEKRRYQTFDLQCNFLNRGKQLPPKTEGNRTIHCNCTKTIIPTFMKDCVEYEIVDDNNTTTTVRTTTTRRARSTTLVTSTLRPSTSTIRLTTPSSTLPPISSISTSDPVTASVPSTLPPISSISTDEPITVSIDPSTLPPISSSSDPLTDLTTASTLPPVSVTFPTDSSTGPSSSTSSTVAVSQSENPDITIDPTAVVVTIPSTEETQQTDISTVDFDVL